jgi:membrane-bound serine protease (ClpP class)
VLANPNVAYLLMALGALGLYVEITNPGGILPGVIGVVFLLLGLYSISVLPVSWAGVALIFVALVLFLLEVKVTSFGLLTIGGLICFVLGSLMLFETPIPAMRVSLGVILPTALVLAGVTGFLLSRVLKTHRLRPLTGVEGMVGKIGTVLSDIDPLGKVLVNGEYWDARTSGPAIPSGASVRVVAVGDKQIDVVPAESAGEGS